MLLYRRLLRLWGIVREPEDVIVYVVPVLLGNKKERLDKEARLLPGGVGLGPSDQNEDASSEGFLAVNGLYFGLDVGGLKRHDLGMNVLPNGNTFGRKSDRHAHAI